MDAPVAISLVVCTRNRAAQLTQHLESIRALRTSRAWEYIIVDNGSTDGTSEVIAGFADSFDGVMRRVHEPRPGLACARNAGLRAARGPIVAWTDDDCYPSADHLDRVAASFEERPDIGFTGGRLLLHDPDDYPISIRVDETPLEVPANAFVAPGVIPGANMAFRRIALESIGGFDDRLGAGTPFPCEDVDAVLRVCLRGWPGVYDPRLVVRHHHRRREPAEIESLLKSYDRGRGAYFAKGVLSSSQRLRFLRWWYWSMRGRDAASVRRELQAAGDFALRFGFGEVRRSFGAR